ncbi:hypothetical protein E2C01_074881 [Portunus trituberculatus]|uniref:Uncharacterized protein n=1 Tax=Portunus trituberculatus TaxID=210409 RepID=A0A5B7IID6_PORTR|nr:hypothetical protein [Portunus trituberculatus]
MSINNSAPSPCPRGGHLHRVLPAGRRVMAPHNLCHNGLRHNQLLPVILRSGVLNLQEKIMTLGTSTACKVSDCG